LQLIAVLNKGNLVLLTMTAVISPLYLVGMVQKTGLDEPFYPLYLGMYWQICKQYHICGGVSFADLITDSGNFQSSPVFTCSSSKPG
jgi:hypothetical protein